MGDDSSIVVDVEEVSGKNTSLFSPYELIINLPYSDHMDEINKMVLDSWRGEDNA